MIYINDKEVNFIYNLGEKVKEVFSYGTKIWPKEVLLDAMYFKLADGYTSGNVSYQFAEYYNLHNKYLKISTDGSNWSDWTEQISMAPNTKYFVKGEDDYVRNSNISGGFFTSDVSQNNFNIECGGNVMSLCNNATEITTNCCFFSLFDNMTNLLTPPTITATTLALSCYAYMFYGCSKLVHVPELPATTLANYCYQYMFRGCSSLTQSPVLPATTLTVGCYYGIFYDCSSLNQAPELPATTLARNCYNSMFYGCSKLVHVPALPATTLENYCYQYMFSGCSSLTQAPALPATTLTVGCYYGMFSGCSSLTQAPVLTATTLARNCYTSMFSYCSKLTQVPSVLQVITLENYCYQYMFSGCSSLTQAPALPATTLTVGCYYGMFSDCSSLTEAPELPATTLASNCYEEMFSNSNKLNWIKALFTTTPSTSYTKNWVNGVSAQGVFVKNIDATWTTTGVNAVPTGWTVIYYDQTEDKYFTTKTKEVECDKYGNVKQKIDAMYFKLADGETSGNVSYQFDEYYNLHNKYLKYSTDGSNWSDWTEAISMAPNVKYYIKGEDDYVRNSDISGGFFSSDVSQNTFNIECGGNVMSLCNMNENITTNYCFCRLFYDMTNLLTAPALPATTLANSCYSFMFSDCSKLTQAPELPATTLANSCYIDMFYGCSSLTQSPALPATTLTNSCYGFMFYNCSSLTQSPALPATTLADGCYYGMFKNCTSLTQAPVLPATTLADYCYDSMFYGCSSLTQAPELPATTLAESCYNYMFDSCTKLTQAPELPATTLVTYCYNSMFSGCSSLTKAPELPATTLASYCYQYMFQNCTALTEAPELPATTLVNECYMSMFESSNNLNWIKALFTTTPSISYTRNWVTSVSDQGVFVKNINATWTTTGVNAVPTGWTVIYFDQTEGKYYTTQTKEVECDKYGNVKQEIDAMYFKLADGETSGNVSYKFDEYYNLHNKYLKISTDGNNWSDWNEQISMAPNVKYFVKGEDDYVRNSNISGGFFTSDVSTQNFSLECGGNVMSLCNNATEITVPYCLKSLFQKMTNLITAPKLPATTLASNCYNSMFNNCTSLTEAPELPATKLASDCYKIMFYKSNKLNWIKALFNTRQTSQYTKNWVNGVSANGVFVKSINVNWTETGVNAVPTGWTVIYYDQIEDKYFKTEYGEEECDKYGNPLV